MNPEREDARSPYERDERGKDAEYIAGIIEAEPWPVIHEKVRAWLHLRRLSDSPEREDAVASEDRGKHWISWQEHEELEERVIRERDDYKARVGELKAEYAIEGDQHYWHWERDKPDGGLGMLRREHPEQTFVARRRFVTPWQPIEPSTLSTPQAREKP